MGVESYTIRLEPGSDENPLMVETLAQTLTENGFQRLSLRTGLGPAHLSAPPENQTEYEKRDTSAVVEAILYWESSPGEPTRTDRLVVTGMDIRFAICQPPTAETQFREIVGRMLQDHNLVIQDGYRNRRYHAGQVSSYLHDLTPLVAGLRANWQRLFGPGYEERVLSSAEAWGYYLNRKQPDAELPSN